MKLMLNCHINVGWVSRTDSEFSQTSDLLGNVFFTSAYQSLKVNLHVYINNSRSELGLKSVGKI